LALGFFVGMYGGGGVITVNPPSLVWDALWAAIRGRGRAFAPISQRSADIYFDKKADISQIFYVIISQWTDVTGARMDDFTRPNSGSPIAAAVPRPSTLHCSCCPCDRILFDNWTVTQSHSEMVLQSIREMRPTKDRYSG